MKIGRCAMQRSDGETVALTPEESWEAIQDTVDRVRSSMYVAGSATILLLWGAITSVGLLVLYFTVNQAPGFMESRPWTHGLLWGALCAVGMVGSAVIGHRASSKAAVGDAARNAGIRVFLFWLAIVAAAFLLPTAAGMWNAEDGPNIQRVAIGIVALGYVLFGIMHRPAIAVVGVGIAAAYYIPSYLAGDAALAVTAGATIAVVVLGWAWIRRSGEL